MLPPSFSFLTSHTLALWQSGLHSHLSKSNGSCQEHLLVDKSNEHFSVFIKLGFSTGFDSDDHFLETFCFLCFSSTELFSDCPWFSGLSSSSQVRSSPFAHVLSGGGAQGRSHAFLLVVESLWVCPPCCIIMVDVWNSVLGLLQELQTNGCTPFGCPERPQTTYAQNSFSPPYPKWDSFPHHHHQPMHVSYRIQDCPRLIPLPHPCCVIISEFCCFCIVNISGNMSFQ